jgi:cytochrome c oxidase subunit 3
VASEHAHLAHHFDDLDQQNESLSLGMWVFLVTEVMIFGGLFAAYTVYRWLYPAAFSYGSGRLNWVLASVNTLVLISSSLTMALAVYGAQVGSRRMLVRCLVLTIVLGLVFLVIKGFEYAEDVHEGLVPAPAYFHVESDSGLDDNQVRQLRLFLALYFCMTGLHAVHMVVGMGVLACLAFLARRGRYSPEYHAPVEMAGLYWHFVDVVWIFLLPLLYLSGTH